MKAFRLLLFVAVVCVALPGCPGCSSAYITSADEDITSTETTPPVENE